MKYILDCFDYNQHFVAMMNIINYAKLTNKDGKFEKHHIIPRCWFNKHNLPVDNSENNLVNLTIEQHRKVHKLAVLCAKEEIKSSLKYASSLMNRESMCGDKNPNYGVKCDEEKRNKISNSVKQAYKDGRLNTKGENNGMYHKKGIIPWNKGKGKPKQIKNPQGVHICSEEAKKKISEAKKEYWKTHTISAEHRKKMNESRRGKKRGKYKKTYTTWYIGPDGKRIYK